MKSAARSLLIREPILPPDVTLFDFAMSPFFSSMKLKEDNWFSWRVIWKVRSGMSLDKKELKFFHKISGGIRYRRGKMPKNVCGIFGRKSAKSTMGVGMENAYDGLRFDPSILAPGEEARSLIICPNFRTSLIDIKFVEGLIENHEALAEHLISRKQTEQIAELVLSNGLTISLMPVTSVTGRGPSTKKLSIDEGAYMKQRGQFCDKKVFEDARPGMIRFGDQAEYGIWSSPGRKRGLVWEYYEKYWGVENDEVLCLKAASRDMNPTLSQAFIDKELLARGEAYVRREFYAEFTDAIESAYSEQSISRCANLIIPSSPETTERFGLMDPAALSPGSTNSDEFTAGVGHVSGGIAVFDETKAWSSNQDATPRTGFNEAVEASIVMLKKWKVKKVYIDKYKIDQVEREMKKAGIEIESAPVKNALYVLLETGLNSGKIKLPSGDWGCQHESAGWTLIEQIKGMERSSGRGDVDNIDHEREGHDDKCNLAALLYYVATKHVTSDFSLSSVRIGPGRESEFGSVGSARDEFKGVF